MILYLTAKSKEKISYTPDWIKMSYKEDKVNYELTLDIQGHIDYDNNTLNCRCKGVLLPWTLLNFKTGDETDLLSYELLTTGYTEKNFSNEKIIEIFKEGYEFRVGVYPSMVNNDEESFKKAKKDKFETGYGKVVLYPEEGGIFTKQFAFETEVNI